MRPVSPASKHFVISLALVGLVALGLLTPVVLVTGYMGLQDFGEWNYQGYVLGRAFRGESLGVATLKEYPVPYSIGNLLLGGLAAVLPPLAAGIVAIGLQILAGTFAVASVVRSQGLDWRTGLPVLAVLVVFGSGLWNGYAAHQIGLAAFTAWLAVSRDQRSRPVNVLIFSLLTFFSHALVFFAFAAAVGILALTDRRLVRVAVAMLPSVALTVWYAVNSPPEGAGGGIPISSPAEWVAYKGYTFAKAGGYQNLMVNGVGDDSALMLMGAAVNTVTVGVVLLLALASAMRLRTTTWRQHPDLLAGLALLAFSVVLPAFFLGIVNPSERIIGPALILLAISVLRARQWPRVAVVASAAAGLGLLLTAFSSATLAMKSDEGDMASQDPSPTFDESSSSRTGTLFGHRLDQMESRFDAAERAWLDGAEPSVPLLFDEGMLQPRR
jgi:hypothetical protein